MTTLHFRFPDIAFLNRHPRLTERLSPLPRGSIRAGLLDWLADTFGVRPTVETVEEIVLQRRKCQTLAFRFADDEAAVAFMLAHAGEFDRVEGR